MMSRTPKLAAVAVLAAFSGLALQVQAQETVELDEVKVTAGRVEPVSYTHLRAHET